MNRANFARISGVIIDTCHGHGMWFDPGEMEKIMDFIAHGGLQKAKEAEIERLKNEETLVRLKNIQIGPDNASRIYFGDPQDFGQGPNLVDVMKWILGTSKD
jgi:Zn-finger nucleic acid-binding protein